MTAYFYPLKVWPEKSVTNSLLKILSDKNYFAIQDTPADADTIIFENDHPSYIRQTAEYRKWPDKCIAVSETDLPSYFLPSCYASNKKYTLGEKRSKTIPFLITEFTTANPFISYHPANTTDRYLYAFKGGSTSWVRKKLFNLKVEKEDVLIQNTSNYHHWNSDASYKDEKTRQQQEYANLLQQSSFFLCPRGAGASSIRLFEVMRAGKVPVILADDWIPVDAIAWQELSIFISENDLSNLDSLIRAKASGMNTMGVKARKAWEQFCAPDAASATLALSISELRLQLNPQREKLVRLIYPAFRMVTTAKAQGRGFAKKMILKILSLTGLKSPYSLNRPVEEQLKKN